MNKTKDNELKKDIEELVIARLNSIPSNLELAVGNKGSFNIEDLKKHVRDNDDVGKIYIQSQLEYIRSLNDLPLDYDKISDYPS